MRTWISNDVVQNALRSKQVVELEKSGLIYSISDDFEYCLIIGEHNAWQINGEGWRDSNEPPQNNLDARRVLNFFNYNPSKKQESWFKIFIPFKYEISKIEKNKDQYFLITASRTLVGHFSTHNQLMWSVVTGLSQQEQEIESKFLSIENCG